MKSPDELRKYKAIASKKLTRANSLFHEGIAFYIAKKDPDDKPGKLYAAYLYPSGYLITAHYNKEILIHKIKERIQEVKDFIEKNDIKVSL